MATATFSDRILRLVGTHTKGHQLEELLEESAREIINDLPESVLTSLITEETDVDGTTGVTMTNKRFVRAHKEGYNARPLDAWQRDRFEDETEGYPGYYQLGETMVVVPDGGTVLTVSYPTIKRTDKTIANWPTAMVDLLMYSTALKVLDAMMTDIRDGYGLTLTLPTAPTAPSAPVFSVSDAAVVAPSATSINALPTAPSYSAPSLDAKPTAPTVGTLDLTKKVNGVTALTAPSAPATPAISFSPASAASVGSLTIDALPSAPTLDQAVFAGSLSMPSLPSLDLTTEIDGTTSMDPPSAPSAPGIAYFNAEASTAVANTLSALGTAPTYQKPVFGGDVADIISAIPASLNLATEINNSTSLAVPDPPSAPSIVAAAQEVTIVDFTDPDAVAPTYTKPSATITLDFSNWQTYFNDEDPEIMAETMRKAGIELQELQARIAEENGDFQKDTEIYRAKIQKAIEDSRLAAQRATNNKEATDAALLNDYVQQLQRYDRQIAEYNAHIMGQMQQFQANISRASTAVATAQRLFLEQYQLDIENARAVFQKELAIYQQDANHKIEQVRTTLQESLLDARSATDVNATNAAKKLEAAVADFNADVNVFNTGLQRYQSEVERQLQTFQLEFQKSFTTWREQQALYLQKYQNDIAQNANAFRGAMEDHGYEVRRIIEQATIDAGRLSQQAQLTTDVDVQNEIQTAATALRNYSEEANLFNLSTQLYRVEADLVVQQFAVQLQQSLRLFEADSTIGVQRYSALVQNARAAFDGELSVYRAGVERNALQAQLTAAEAAQTASLSTDINQRNMAKDVQLTVEAYNAQVNRYRAQLEDFSRQTDQQLNQKRVITESTSAKLRMMSFDRKRLEGRFVSKWSTMIRNQWRARSIIVQQHPI